jgi:hypothetical protein
MSDPIPSPIYAALKGWLAEKTPCKVELHVNGEGQIVQADRILKEKVRAA